MSDDRTPKDAPSPPDRSEESRKPSDPDEHIEKMERAIEHVDDHIEDAESKAEEAESHDPQPLTHAENEQDDTA